MSEDPDWDKVIVKAEEHDVTTNYVKAEEKEPVEFTGIKTLMVDLINAEDNLTRLRDILTQFLGLGGETIEMQQLTLMKIEWDRKLGELETGVKQWKLLTKALAVGVVILSGYIGLDVAGILKILGIGG